MPEKCLKLVWDAKPDRWSRHGVRCYDCCDGVGTGTERQVREAYGRLREIAASLLKHERNEHTLQRTALVHEAVLRLLKTSSKILSTQELLSLAAHQMREILIDYGRKHGARKRGSDLCRVPLYEIDHGSERDEDTLLALNQALDRLAQIDRRVFSVVELKFFGGYTNAETAAILGVSDATVEADWQYGRSWLFGAPKEKAPRSQV